MSDRVTVERKEFEDFLAENQKLLDRSQALMDRIDELESEDRQLRDELQATKARLGAMESNMASSARVDELVGKARETMSRLAKEVDKRISIATRTSAPHLPHTPRPQRSQNLSPEPNSRPQEP
ncbi:MAG: hypothetical protein WB661_07105 [Candidatus Bathyarchaeia archaeon]